MNGDVGGLEELVQRVLRRAVGAVHPAELLADAEARVRERVRDGVAPNRVRIVLATGDFLRLAPDLPEFEQELRSLLAERARNEGWRFVAPVDVEVVADPEVAVGVPKVSAEVRLGATPPPLDEAFPTRALRRPRQRWWVQVEGGERMPIAFLPFRIGRARENDLVLPGLLVSRRHAEVIDDGRGGAILRDVGSRNGILVAGERAERVPLRPGLAVQIGEFTLRFETNA